MSAKNRKKQQQWRWVSLCTLAGQEHLNRTLHCYTRFFYRNLTCQMFTMWTNTTWTLCVCERETIPVHQWSQVASLWESVRSVHGILYYIVPRAHTHTQSRQLYNVASLRFFLPKQALMKPDWPKLSVSSPSASPVPLISHQFLWTKEWFEWCRRAK